MSNSKFYRVLKNLNIWPILLTNLLTIGWSLYENLSFINILVLYFGQTFVFILILILQVLFLPGDAKFNQEVKEKKIPIYKLFFYRILAAAFISFPFFFFQFIYAIFIGLYWAIAAADNAGKLLSTGLTEVSWADMQATIDSNFIWSTLAFYALAQGTVLLIDFVRGNYKFDPGAGFWKIFPTHLILMFGMPFFMTNSGNQILIFFFLLFKLLADLALEYRQANKNSGLI